MVKTLTHYMWFPLKDNVRISTCASIYSIENEESGFVNCILYSIYTIDNIEVRLVKIFLRYHYKHNSVYLRLKWLHLKEILWKQWPERQTPASKFVWSHSQKHQIMFRMGSKLTIKMITRTGGWTHFYTLIFLLVTFNTCICF